LEKKRFNLIPTLFIFLLIQLVLDFIFSRFLLTNSPNLTRVETIIKGIKLLFVVYLVGIIIKTNEFKTLKSCFFLGICISIGFIFVPIYSKSLMPFIREWLLYCFPLLLLNVLAIQKPSDTNKIEVLKCTVSLIGVIAFFVLIGFLFDIQIFRTYEAGLRFGYMGILHKSVHASYFFISSLLFLYYYSFIYRYFSTIFFWFTLFCSLLVGTKAIYLFVASLFFYAVLHQRMYKNRFFYLSLIILFLGAFLVKNQLIQLFQNTFSVLVDVYHKKGLITSLMSYRNEIIETKLQVYFTNWSIINFFFGGKIMELGLFEVSTLDLFVFMGFIGGAFYLFIFLNEIKYLITINQKIFKLYYILCLFIISNLAGQLFNNFSSMLYILLILYLINFDLNKNTKI